MKKKLWIAVMALVSLSLSWAMAQEKTKAPATAAQKTEAVTFKFKGGSCQVSEIFLNSTFAPGNIKDGEKPFLINFAYTLNRGVESDALSVLYNEGKFVAPDGKTYKAGAALSNDTTYSLIVAVPKDLNVETLSFVFGNQKVPLKPFIKK